MERRMSTCLLFDCDGVLLTKPDVNLVIQKWAKDHTDNDVSLSSIETARQQLLKTAQQENLTIHNDSERKQYYIDHNQRLLEALDIPASPAVAEELYEALQNTHYQVYPDTEPALSSLAQESDLTLGVLSNWTYTLPDVLKEAGIDHFFEFVFSSYELKVAKPDPKIFTTVLERIGTFDRVFYIGDQYEMDILPALEVGITPILLDRTGIYKQQEVKGLCIKSLSELKSAL